MRQGTIVYVHGASDRGAQVDDHVARIQDGLRRAGMHFDVLPSRWGEANGADLNRIEDALPPPAPTAGAGWSVRRAMLDLGRLAGAASGTRVTSTLAPWPDQPGITDHEVDLGVGFPDSHGAAYLSHPDVFRAIDVHPALAVVAPRARRRRTGYGGVQKRLS